MRDYGMIDPRELAWAAGLFEGEGSIGTHRDRGARVSGRVWHSPILQLTMTDEDTVRRFREAVGMGNVTGPYQYTGNRKPAWRWAASGFPQAQAIIAFLWFGLGTRRRERAREVLRVATPPARWYSLHVRWHVNAGKPCNCPALEGSEVS